MSIRSAQILLARGEQDAAEAALASAPSGDPRAAFVRSRILDARGESRAARDTLERTAQDLPVNVPAQLFAGVAALDAGDAPAAEAGFARTLALQPDNDLARAYRALALLHLGREQEGVAILRAHGFSDNRMFVVRLTEWMELQWLVAGRFFAPRAIEPPEPRPAPRGWLARRASERRAERHFFAKRYRELLGELDAQAHAGRPDPDIVFACAIAAEMLFDNERALDHIAVIGDGEEMPDPLRAARARNLLRLGEFARAAEDLNRVLIIGPEDYGVNYFLGVLCLSHSRPAQARNLFLRAHADYMVDTLEFQFWQMQQALFDTADATAGTAKNA